MTTKVLFFLWSFIRFGQRVTAVWQCVQSFLTAFGHIRPHPMVCLFLAMAQMKYNSVCSIPAVISGKASWRPPVIEKLKRQLPNLDWDFDYARGHSVVLQKDL